MKNAQFATILVAAMCCTCSAQPNVTTRLEDTAAISPLEVRRELARGKRA